MEIADLAPIKRLMAVSPGSSIAVMPVTQSLEATDSPNPTAAGLHVVSVHYETHYLDEGHYLGEMPARTVGDEPRWSHTSFVACAVTFGGWWIFGIFICEILARWLLGFDPGWNAATLGLAFASGVALLSRMVASPEQIGQPGANQRA